jgi:hypothetical protein
MSHVRVRKVFAVGIIDATGAPYLTSGAPQSTLRNRNFTESLPIERNGDSTNVHHDSSIRSAPSSQPASLDRRLHRLPRWLGDDELLSVLRVEQWALNIAAKIGPSRHVGG